MPAQKLKVAISGLGRMGARHAHNYLHRTPRAELVAVFSPDESERQWAHKTLEPYGVTVYSDYDKMLDHEGLEAVVVATVTSVHADHTLKALAKNKHVMCEKPISTDPAIVTKVIETSKAKPHLKLMCGFSRRFDASYRDAFEKTQRGVIGRPVFFRSQTCDKHNKSGWYVKYSEQNGGCFVDMSVHDIDLALWFFGEDSAVKSIAASGVCATEPGLAALGDTDNAVGIVEFWGGKVAYFFNSRMMAHGQEDTTEVIGTEGKYVINGNPALNHLVGYTEHGVVREAPATYWDRFEYAFVTESQEFTNAVLDDTELPIKVETSLRVTEIAQALQEACLTGRKLYFDESGRRVEVAKV